MMKRRTTMYDWSFSSNADRIVAVLLAVVIIAAIV
jgi:hypothetical protein